jgi:hypothetical protein
VLAYYQRQNYSITLNPESIPEPKRGQKRTLDRAVFFQSYPNEFENELFASLGDVAKKIYLGTCCEGMFRTNKPNNAALTNAEYIPLNRVNSYQLRVVNEQFVYVVSHCGAFGNDAEMNRYLIDYWKSQGYNAAYCQGTQWNGRKQKKNSAAPTDVASTEVSSTDVPATDVQFVLDADDSPLPVLLEQIQRLQSQHPQSQFAVYLQSPRIHERTALKDLSVQVIAK